MHPTEGGVGQVPCKIASRWLGPTEAPKDGEGMAKAKINPYEPTRVQSGDESLTRSHHTLIVPFRLDGLTVAALTACLVDAVSIWIFFANGTGIIADRILAPLAASSAAWIPIYRLAVPVLIPVMPQTCRQSFAVFCLTSGIGFSINNLSGHFWGDFVLLSHVGLFETGAIFFAFGLVAFCFGVFRFGNFARSLCNTVVWIGFAMLVQLAFYFIGHAL